MYLGSAYINDFNYLGRTYQVMAQADEAYRLTAGDIGRYKTRNDAGEMVPIGTNWISPMTGVGRGGQPWGQPFTYDLFDALMPSEFERRGSWFAESSEPPNCCWAYGITPQFRRDSIRRDPSTA